ncbi:hypothetical protein CI109_102256 [Kwoniella shandongensis]|uniref:Uncharacterized protein n=1 Tax=Kwoniella shandongensis TaxID=1734106 RepID=A0A5M6BYK5_9TREE|nr:uncharacterized protein CI109_003590 [Kwoniella shandongensis]KAA5527937.1 hypothetical protein CI109_003590 [Kwoniella shandongensis]
MSYRGGGGRGGRGTYPPRAKEDRDVQSYANKRVANLGPPTIQTTYRPPRERGRGGGGYRGSHPRGSAGPSREFRREPPSGPRSLRPIVDTYRPSSPGPSSMGPDSYQPSRAYSPSALTREDSRQPRRRLSPSTSQHDYSRQVSPARTDASRPYRNVKEEFGSGLTDPSSSRHPSGHPSLPPRPHSPPLANTAARSTPSAFSNRDEVIHILSSPPPESTAGPSRLTTNPQSLNLPSFPIFQTPVNTSIQPPVGQPAASSSALPSRPQEISRPPNEDIPKMKFRPKMPIAKGKGKEKESTATGASAVKAEPRLAMEPEPEPAATVESSTTETQVAVDEDQAMENDVKPRLQDMVEEESAVDAVREEDRKEGVLAINKHDLPPECFGNDASLKKKARLKSRQLVTAKLAAQGRKIVKAHWRNDGVAYDWRAVRPDPDSVEPEIQPAQVQEPERVVKKARSRRNVAPVIDMTDDDSTPAPLIPSRTALQSEEEQLTNGEPSTSESYVPKDSCAPPPGPISTKYQYEVPLPADFSTAQLRHQNRAALPKWKQEQWALAAGVDAQGLPTRGAKLKMPEDEGTMLATLTPLELLPVEKWPFELFTHSEVVQWPKKWSSKMLRKSNRAGLKEWIEHHRNKTSEPDSRGRPTRWVRAIRAEEHIKIYWKEKEQDDIEKYTGPLIEVDPKQSSPTALTGSKSSVQRNATPGPSGTTANEESPPVIPSSQKKKKVKRDRDQTEASIPESAITIDPPPKTKKRKSDHEVEPTISTESATGQTPSRPPAPVVATPVTSNTPRLSSTPAPAPTRTSAPAPTPVLARTSAPTPPSRPITPSPELERLNANLRQKISEISKWTKVLNEYPDMAQALDEQVRRTQAEIFGLHDAIRVEKHKLGMKV